ncbi:putative transporter [Cladobotryum mycophilum]|uniref:Transporter n=1 Tax=Cladobotryum mycophilum TaxID=491253 RepID=A0ABR0T3A4_9HYPO
MGPTNRNTPGSAGDETFPTFSSSFRSGSPLAERFLAQDIAECSDHEGDDDHLLPPDSDHVMYRRPSGVAYGTARPVFNHISEDEPAMTPLERKQSRNAEASLLRDNHVLPPKRHHSSRNPFSRLYQRIFTPKLSVDEHEESPILSGNVTPHQPAETSPLISSQSSSDGDVEQQWEEAITAGLIQTTWQRETKTLLSYCAPSLALSPCNTPSTWLVFSLSVVLVYLNLEPSHGITCTAPVQGLATSLDTLCAQAYGSGHKHLVGLQCQRMACFLLLCSIPVAFLWLFGAEAILTQLVPDPELARLSGMYLRVMVFAIPGIILFECGKRFTQAQGLFKATTYVLIVAAPVNVFLTWLFVFKLEYGFVGAPMAVVITDSLLPILLFFYVYFVGGRQCWGGFSRRALANWWVMIRLSLPGMIMVEAEWLAFEVMTLMASRFGAKYLAAQSVISTIGTIAFQIPFPMSIAASTRVANLMGAGLVDAAKITAKVAFVIHFILGITNSILYTSFRFQLPQLFTNDPEVIAIVAVVLPIPALMQLADCISTGAHGLLRGIGKQAIGGPINLIAYYVISLPLSVALAFGLDWKLQGLWAGITVGLVIVAIVEYAYLIKTDWHKAAREAAVRNAAG